MTTIAYKDGWLAADSLATTNGTVRSYRTQKIHAIEQPLHKILAATAGTLSACKHLLRHLSDHGLEGDYKCPPEDIVNALIYAKKKLWLFDGGAFELLSLPLDSPYALGSGEDFALGAMDAGATAAEAVEIAIKRDCYSGGEVQSVELSGFVRLLPN